MKTFSLTIALGAAVLTLAGCPGNATDTTTNGTHTNTAVVVGNSNTMTMNSNIGNSMGNMANAVSNSMSNMANSMTGAAADTSPSGFMTAAATSGNNEIAAAKLALTKTKNAEVKQYAQQMIADHTKAANELKPLAAKEKVTLPTEPDAAHKTMADSMSKLSGDEFDKEYLKGQVDDHEKAVALFEAQSTGGTDTDAKAFATKTLPTLKMHLEMAQKLSAKMK